MKYEKANAEVIYFTNGDVIVTSGGTTECPTNGWDRGNNCHGNKSGDCPTKQAWK